MKNPEQPGLIFYYCFQFHGGDFTPLTAAGEPTYPPGNTSCLKKPPDRRQQVYWTGLCQAAQRPVVFDTIARAHYIDERKLL